MTSSSRPRAETQAIPRFALYGEAPTAVQELLHIEDVRSRSRLYQWEIRPHVHQGLHQILWIFRGEAEVRLDERARGIVGPAAVFIPPQVVHGFRFAPETDGLVLTLSARFAMEGEATAAGEAFRDLFETPGVLAFESDAPVVARIDALFREVAEEFATPGAADSPALLWLARSLLWRLARARAAETPERGRRQRGSALHARFLQLVEAHVLDRWPLQRYGERLGLSVPRLNRLARAHGGRPALEIIHDRLTREACRRLFYVAAPAEKLALELGFEDPAYFSRFFKRRTGLGPREWREKHRGEA